MPVDIQEHLILPVEILSVVLEYLFLARDRISLSRCARVHSTFYSEAKRWLYHAVTVTLSSSNVTMYGRSPLHLIAKDPTVALYVKTLAVEIFRARAESYKFIYKTIPMMHNLKRLRIAVYTDDFAWDFQINSTKFDFLELRCNLTPTIQQWVGALTTLREVDLRWLQLFKVKTLSALPPTVQVVHAFGSAYLAKLVQGCNISQLTLKMDHRLTFDMDHDEVAHSKSLAQAMCSSHAPLLHLHLQGINLYASKIDFFAQVLHNFCVYTPSIETLHVSFCDGSLGQLTPGIRDAFSSFPNLHTIVLHDSMLVDKESSKRLKDGKDVMDDHPSKFVLERMVQESAVLLEYCRTVQNVEFALPRSNPKVSRSWRRGVESYILEPS